MVDLQSTIENLHTEYETKMKTAFSSFDADLSRKELEIFHFRREYDDMQLALNAERTVNELLKEEMNQLHLKVKDMSFGADEILREKQEREVELASLLSLYKEQEKVYKDELTVREKEYEKSLTGLKSKVTELENKASLQAETETDHLSSKIKFLEASLSESIDIRNELSAEQGRLESSFEIMHNEYKSKIASLESENESLKVDIVQALDSRLNYENALSQEKNDLNKQLMLCRTELALLEDVSATEITRIEDMLQKQASRYSEEIVILQEDLAKVISEHDKLVLEVNEKNMQLQVLEYSIEEAHSTDKQERDRLKLKIHSLTTEILKFNDATEKMSKQNGNIILHIE